MLLVTHTYGSSRKTMVGGGVRANETPEAAVRREVQEEVGIMLAQVTKVGEVSHQTEYKQDTVHVFVAAVETDDVCINSAEIDTAQWYAMSALPPDMSPLTKEFLALARPYTL